MGWRRIARLQLMVSLLCCWAAAAWAANVQVRAELKPTTFALDQTAEFIITVEGTSSAQPDLPLAPGLYFQSRGQSQQTSWVNGQVSASVTFSFAVQASKPGQYTIGPVTVRAGGKTYQTQPLHCTVGPASHSSASQPAPGSGSSSTPPLSADEAARIGSLRIMPQKDTFYLGEIIPFTLKAYFQSGQRINIDSAPVLIGDSFLIHEVDKEPIQRQEQFMGQWGTSLTWQGKLSAVKEGPAALSVQLDADLLIRKQRQRSTDPFDMFDDPFFDNFFSNYSKREIKLASPAAQVNVLPLPTKGRPADFSGAVGTFSLAVTASPVDGRIGEPISLKMRIEGKGNFDRVQAPVLTDRKGWKLYPASAKFAGQNGGKGAKTFEQAVIPTDSSLTAVPPLHFSYFDPTAKDYVSLSSEPIPLHLQQGADPAQPLPAAPAQPAPDPKKALPKTKQPVMPQLPLEPGEMVRSIQPLYRKQWFQHLMAGVGCCLTAGLLLDMRRKKLENNPGLVRRKVVARQLARHFQAMRKAIRRQDQERFQQHCREAVQTWAGAAWERAPEAITLADLQARLSANSPLLALFTRLEQSGYAGGSLEPEEMENMLQTAQQELT
ncbi:Oxygen tolerance [Candidatus Electronema halotolerans]